jgi:hypothetical protein
VAFLEDLLARVRGVYQTNDWPPPALKDHWDEIEYYQLRYRNDPGKLLPYSQAYSGSSHARRKQYTPVPFAREMARLSSSLLFSEPAKVVLESNQDSVDELLATNGAEAFWQDSAETVAVEGRGGLRILRDPNIDPRNPLITYVNENQVIWDIHHGRFVRGGIVVIEAESANGRDTFRMLESHEPGLITRRVYRGQTNVLGSRVSATSDSLPPEIRGFKEQEPTGLNVPTLIEWPNVPGARSDLFGIEILLERIDEAESMMVEKAWKSRPWIFSSRSLADENGNVDIANLIFLSQGEAAQYLEAEGKTGAPVIHVQPDMQTTEHVAYLEHLREEALTKAGYSLASYGLGDTGAAESGTALKLKQARTLNNRQSKERMAREAMTTAIATAMAIKHRSRDIAPFKPEISFGDGMPEDEVQTATVLTTLKGSNLISDETAIRQLHPDWDDKAVEEEVARIKGQQEAQAPPQRGGRLQALLRDTGEAGQQAQGEPPTDEEANGSRARVGAVDEQ